MNPQLVAIKMGPWFDRQVKRQLAPALTYPDASFVARSMTFAMIVTAAEKCTAAEIERTSAYLKQSGVTLLGRVVTGIAGAYAERDVR